LSTIYVFTLTSATDSFANMHMSNSQKPNLSTIGQYSRTGTTYLHTWYGIAKLVITYLNYYSATTYGATKSKARSTTS